MAIRLSAGSVFVSVILSFRGGLSLDNGLALKPPLGWSSWLALGERDFCDEKSLRDSADALVSTGLAVAGYDTLMISDCWGATERDSDGNLQAEKDRFPSGSLKSVIEYIHGKGLKAGVYQDIGATTCVGKRAGMYGHYEQDAHLLAVDWQIDWIKVDNCADKGDPRVYYPQLEKAFNATGHPVLINLCEWGLDAPWEGWASKCGNSWRVFGDHRDQFNGSRGTRDVILHQIGMSKWTGAPRHGWNDMDMIFTGLAVQQPPSQRYFPGQTETEYITEFSMWALLQSPLVWTGDVRNMTAFQRRVLFNHDILAIHNDTSSPQGDLLARSPLSNDSQIWGKRLSGGGWAVVLVNLGEKPTPNQLSFDVIGWTKVTHASVKDVWSGEIVQAVGVYPSTAITQEPHSCVMAVLTKTG